MRNLIRRILKEHFKSEVVTIEWFGKDKDRFTFDGVLAGEGYTFGDTIVIQYIQSREPNKGYAKKFLQELKKHYKKTIASGVDENSAPFWKHMLDLRLIDLATDDGGSDYDFYGSDDNDD